MVKCDTCKTWWLFNILKYDFRHPLKLKDMYLHKFDGHTELITKQLEHNWNIEIDQCMNPNLRKILIKTFGIWPLIAGAMFSTIEIFSSIQIPIYVGCIISFYATDGESVTRDDLHRCSVRLATFLIMTSFLYSPLKFYLNAVCMKMKGACSSLIYQKSLNLNDIHIDLVVCLLTNDVQNMDNFLIEIHHIWRAPLETAIIVYIMYCEVGNSAILGSLILLSAIPIQTVLSRLINDNEMHLDRATEKRINFVQDCINGIKTIKTYAWEKLFEKLIQRIREREINIISQRSYLYSVLQSTSIIPRLAAFITFVTYIMNGRKLISRHIFMITLWYQFLNFSIIKSFPTALAKLQQAVQSIDRIQYFLLKSNGSKKQINDLLMMRSHNTITLEKGCVIYNVSATWNEDVGAGIYSIDLNLQSNCIYGINGKKGSGKSTLLSTIMGELECDEGKIEINGKLSYASQEPWSFNDTIKQNILLGEEIDENRYKTICRICTLDKDFESLKFGEQTIVEETGQNLSDDQKSKINLARAIYRQADIYVIDDPLCIANSQIGPYIFENCFQKFLKGKCVLLVTNEIKYLKLVNQIITMEDGRVKQIGKFDQSFENDFVVSCEDRDHFQIRHKEMTEETATDVIDANVNENQPGPLSTLQSYFDSLQNTKLLGLGIGLIFISQVSTSGIDFFVSEWAHQQDNTTSRVEVVNDHQFERDLLGTKSYLYMYTILMIAMGYLIFQRASTMCSLSLDVSGSLHKKLINIILSAKLQFFKDSKPEKLLQNLFHDMKTIDLDIPMDLLNCLTFLAEVVFMMSFIVIANRFLIIPSLAMILIFYGILTIAIKSLRHITTIESIHLNAVTAHVNTSVQGGTNIRAYNAQTQFTRKFNKYQDESLAITYLSSLHQTSFTFIVDIICCCYIIVVIVSLLFVSSSGITESSLGLAITQALILKVICQRQLQKTFDGVMRLCGVTKILNYYKCDREPSANSHNIFPATYKWPKHGHVTFKNVNLNCSDNTTNGLNFEIKPKEKIAILGTHKSLFIDTIFRFYEPNEGCIKIDGFDIQKINLNDLRRNMSIIVHEPMTFFGTVRFNLDPLNEKSDTEINKLLLQIIPQTDFDHVNIKKNIDDLNMRQQQMVCLARALLRQNKIIIVDESTESFDDNFSKMIHLAIEKICSDCTIILLANRLNHVMNCDRIMILDDGHLFEYDHPYKIVEKRNKYFKVLLDKCDDSQRAELINTARKNYKFL